MCDGQFIRQQNKDKVAEDVTAQVENQDSGVEADDSLSADEIRTIALKEVYQATRYMQTCGALDKGYDNCSVSLSEQAKPYFTMVLTLQLMALL